MDSLYMVEFDECYKMCDQRGKVHCIVRKTDIAEELIEFMEGGFSFERMSAAEFVAATGISEGAFITLSGNGDS